MATKKDHTCRRCGTKGHNARSPECPKRKAPAGKTRAPLTRRSPKPKAAQPAANGFAGLLAELRSKRDDYETAIRVLERIEAGGR